jgi:monoamine oxidase
MFGAAMRNLTRRSFLTGTAAMTAGPALGAVQQKQKAAPGVDPRSGADVVIIGAGAAGIAAARRIVAAGRKCIVLEAAAEVGGRCTTDTGIFGVPYDRGARLIHTPESNPVAKLAAGAGVDIYPAPPGQRVRIARRYARESEMEDLLATMARANIAIAETARKADVACSTALPKDLGEWRATVEFMLGPYYCGKDLAEVSTADLSRAADRDVPALCRQGLGALMARLAANLSVRLASPATRITWSGRVGVEVETEHGTIDARAAIVTASTNVLSAGKLRFVPELPSRPREAIERLKLGSYDHITLELAGNPLGLRADELVFERATGSRTAALLANIGGTNLCTVDVGGRFGRELAAKGPNEMVAFALEWLDNTYGTSLKRASIRSHATRWNLEPWVLGAMSAASPGGQAARRTLQEPLNNRIWFAGEAVHERSWGTVGGAWESGERAATAVLRVLAPPEPARPKAQPKPRQRQQL